MPTEPPTSDPSGSRPRFLVDGMLLKLGRYLRCLGYDATWDAAASTRARMRTADAEGRVFLTRNLRLRHEPPVARELLVICSDDPVRQLAEVVEALGLDAGELFTRCIRCNVPLEPLSPEAVAVRAVPPRVRARYRAFFGCPRCGTTFWKGTHVRNTCRKLGLPDASEL